MSFSAANLQYLLQEINTLQRQLAARGPLPAAVREPLRLHWVYDTARLAGAGLTRTDAELLLRYGQSPARALLPGEAETVQALAAAFDQVQQWAASRSHRLDAADLLELAERASWRGLAAQVPPAIADAEALQPLEDLAGWYRVVTFEKHPVLAGAELFYEVVSEKPFGQGADNEPLAVLLLNYHLARHGFPPVTVRNDDQSAYRQALGRARPGEFSVLAEFWARQAVYALETALLALRGEAGLQADWEAELSRLEADVLPPAPPTGTARNALPARLADSVAPLLQLVLTKFARFDRFYEQAQHALIIRHHDREETFDVADYAAALERIDAGTVQSFTLRLHWSGYRLAAHRALQAELVVAFEGAQYELWFPGRLNLVHVKPYDAALSETEQRQVVDLAGAWLVERMRSAE